MNKKFVGPLSLEEVLTTTISMGKNKAPRPNGMVVEFYTFF
jgi:hypothetical protein